MTTKNFAANATQLIASFGNAAHHTIGLYRAGGERLGQTLEGRYKSALEESSARLTPETRKNAARAQQVFSGYYAKGLALSADGAEAVIDTLVGAAATALERAAAFQHADTAKAA